MANTTRRQSASMNLCDIKIVMLGQTGVGKTSITNQYIKGSFEKEYVSNSLTHYYKPDVEIENQRYSLEIIDTMGNEEYDPLLDQWIYLGDAFGLVYQLHSSHPLNITSLVDIFSSQSNYHNNLLKSYQIINHQTLQWIEKLI